MSAGRVPIIKFHLKQLGASVEEKVFIMFLATKYEQLLLFVCFLFLLFAL